MLIDAKLLSANEVIETEVCIVGTGPVGLSLAHEFAGQGFRVCLLESGNLEKPDADLVALAEVETEGDFVQVKPDVRNRMFGGNSSFWAINLPSGVTGPRHRPLDEVDFEQRDWIPYSGWPFDRSHLIPYYERAQRTFGMGPFAYEGSDWQDSEHPVLPFDGSRITTRMFQFSPGKQFFEHYRQQVQQAEDITTYFNATVVELETNDLVTEVERVRVKGLDGKQFWVKARYTILAVGGVESAQLLLLSNQVQQAGLGNQHDLVGRFFMDHPLVYGGVFIPTNRQIFNRTGLYDLRYVNGACIMGFLGLTDAAMRRERLPNISFNLFPRPKRFLPSPAVDSLKQLASLRSFKQGTALRDAGTALMGANDIFDMIYDKITRPPQPLWSNFSTGGWSHLQPQREKVYHMFEVLHQTEQLPNPNNRVRLSDNLDKLGRRRVRMETQWRQADIEGVMRAQQVLAEEIARTGLGRYEIARPGGLPALDTHGTAHHMGTTRMHIDPKQGVVDPNCKVHSVSNLFIASSAVFPTGGYANPTITAVALAIRIADQIKTLLNQSVELSLSGKS
jgi:choline dehydrogenase-like flavoprotein